MTPTTATECSRQQGRCLHTLLHVRAFEAATITASDRSWRRVAAPDPLPELGTTSLDTVEPLSFHATCRARDLVGALYAAT
jgi:hypothetical protein